MRGCFPLFFGLFFVLIGIEIILKFFFRIHLPLIRLLFAFIFIYIGVSILAGKPFMFRCHDRWGEERCWNGDAFGKFSCTMKDREVEDEKINVVFGEKRVDLTGMKIRGEKARVRLDCVFGEMKVKLDEAIPARVSGTAVFGSLNLPENEKVVFGTNRYESANFDATKPYLEIEASVVFGEITIR